MDCHWHRGTAAPLRPLDARSRPVAQAHNRPDLEGSEGPSWSRDTLMKFDKCKSQVDRNNLNIFECTTRMYQDIPGRSCEA